MRGAAVFAVLCWLALPPGILATATGSDAPSSVRILQLSDVHISSGNPGVVEDLQRLGGLLSGWALDAILLTGDLVHAKGPGGRGRQDSAEWEAYSQAWRLLAEAAGLPLSRVLDTRGNHDSFDVALRGGPSDLYSRYSARAHAAAAAASAAARSEGAGATAPPNATVARVTVDYVRPVARSSSRSSSSNSSWRVKDGRGMGRLLQWGIRLGFGSGGDDDADDATSEGVPGCPAAVLVGLDVTPSPGLRPPTNFFGLAGRRRVSDELEAALQRSRRELAVHWGPGCRPATIAYGHHPLSVIVYEGDDGEDDGVSEDAPHSGAGDKSGEARGSERRAPRRLEHVLAGYGVSAYLAGHLHDVFGRRMHRLHTLMERDGGSAAGADRAAAPILAELETTDWRVARRLRLLTVDGGSWGFADLRLAPPAPAAAGLLSAATTQSGGKGGGGAQKVYCFEYRMYSGSTPRNPYDALSHTLLLGALVHVILTLWRVSMSCCASRQQANRGRQRQPPSCFRTTPAAS